MSENKSSRPDYQIRAEQQREKRGRPGWKGTLTLNSKRHQQLKAQMLSGETEQKAIIRLLNL